MSVAIIISISLGVLLLLGSIAFLVWYYRDILFGDGSPSPSPIESPPPATPPSPATTPPSPATTPPSPATTPQPSKNTETASPAPV